MASKTTSSQTKALFYDSSCNEIKNLAQHSLIRSNSFTRERNPLDDIDNFIQQKKLSGESLEELHILAHGSQYGIKVGNTLIDLRTIRETAHKIAGWQLKRLILWSCSIGCNESFTQLLSQLSGARIFSSAEEINRNRPIVQDTNNEIISLFNAFESQAVLSWNSSLPVIVSTPDLLASSDDGLSNTDNDTTVQTPSFSGTGPKNTLIELIDQSNSIIGSATSDDSGNYNITTSPLSAGTYNVKARYSSTTYAMTLLTGAGESANIPSAITITAADQLFSPQQPYNGYYLDLPNASSSGTSLADTWSDLTAAYNLAKTKISLWGDYQGDGFEITVTGASYAGNNITYVILEGSGSNLSDGNYTLDAGDYIAALTNNPNGDSSGSYITTTAPTGGLSSSFVLSSSALSVTIATPSDTTAPTVANQYFSYAENQSTGATVASVIASDSVGVTQFRFENSGGTPGSTSTDGFYQIDSSGNITITSAGVAAAAQNDFETTPNSFSYGIQAGDAANNWSAAATITLNVTDVDDTAPSSPAPPLIDQVPADPAPAGTNIQPKDDDGDGLREVVTSSDGTSVDGNRDGIPDAQQTKVAGLRLINDGAKGSDYGALVVSPGVQLSGVTLTAPSTDGSIPVTARGGGTVVTTTPDGLTNAFAGVVSFDISGVTPGGATQATISFPSGLPSGSGNAYVRFNYSTNRFEEYVDTAGNPLYSFVDSDGDGVFDAVNLTLVDGDPNWDGDGQANGTVVDPGFLAVGERSFLGTQRKDTLIGNVLANSINGKKGNDWLQGGLGIDVLIGGRGNDRYEYTSPDESTTTQRDSVKFGKGDRFVFSSFDGDTITEGQQKLTFIGKQAFSGVAGELRATRSVLEADLNGDSMADFAVNLSGSGLISSSNLVL